MFVVMALVTTVATTPLTKALYPPWYQKKVERWRRGEIDWDGKSIHHAELGHEEATKTPVETQIRRLMVHLRLDSLPSLFTFITLLSPESAVVPIRPDTAEEPSQDNAIQIRRRPLEVHGLRVIELTDRTSSVMHLTEGEDFYSGRDPVVNAFRTFSQLHDVAVSGRVAVIPADSYAETLMTQASEVSSDFALIPWGEYGSVSEDLSFPVAVDASERFRSTAHLDFINQTLQKARSTCNAGIFIDNGFGGITKPTGRLGLVRTASALSIRSHRDLAALPAVHKAHHIFLPFFGSADDRVAARLVLQLAKNQHVTASIVRIIWPEPAESGEMKPTTTTESHGTLTPDPKYAAEEDKTTRQSDQQDETFFAALQTSLSPDLASRVVVGEAHVTSPASALAEIVVLAQQTVGQRPKNAGDVVVLGRRNARLGGALVEGSGSSSSLDLKRTVGPVAEQLVNSGLKASILVVQAGGRGVDG